MSEREQVRHARRETLDAKRKTPQGREEIVILWRSVVASSQEAREIPTYFQMVDAILEHEFPPA